MARSITLSWDAVDGAVDGYNVYRGSLQGAQSDIPLNGPNLVKDNKYVDETGDQSTVYFYKVSAVKDGRESNKSHEFRSPALPHSPKNVMAAEAGDASSTPAGKAAQAHAAALIADANAAQARKDADAAEAKANQAKADADTADQAAADADAQDAANASNPPASADSKTGF
jgi:fibronectin type 3 domain-containing protein